MKFLKSDMNKQQKHVIAAFQDARCMMFVNEALVGVGMLVVTHKSDCDQGLSGLP